MAFVLVPRGDPEQALLEGQRVEVGRGKDKRRRLPPDGWVAIIFLLTAGLLASIVFSRLFLSFMASEAGAGQWFSPFLIL